MPAVIPLLRLVMLVAATILAMAPSSLGDLTTARRPSTRPRTRSIVKRVNTDPIEGASIQNLTLSSGSLSTWVSNGPVPQNIESVVISTHGVDGNARDYYLDINAAYWTAKSAGLPRTHVKTLRMAPYFFDLDDPDVHINNDTLGWTEDRWWCEARGASQPEHSDMTPFKIWDELVAKFSDTKVYPKVKYITFVGHGCGGIATQGYAVVGNPPSRPGIEIRYVVGNPSTEVYFTTDRPTTFSPLECPPWDEWPISLKKFNTGYPQPGPAATVFKRYIGRDVRYLVGLQDNGGGDQSCQAKILGGVPRKDRTLAYWKYIHLLSGDGDPAQFTSFPGNFTNLNDAEHQPFKGGQVTHRLFQFPDAGHEPGKIINSPRGRNAIWGN